MRRRAATIPILLLLLAGCRRGEETRTALTPLESSASAGGATLHLRLDRDKAAVGEAVRLELSVEGAAGREIGWPDLGESLATFHVKRLPAASGEGDGKSQRSWVLRPLEAGEIEVPAIGVTIGAPDATSQPAEPLVLRSEPVTLAVAAVAPADADPASMPALVDDPRSLPIDQRLKWAMAAASVIAAIVIVALLIRWLRRRRREAPPPPPIPPDEWALEQLRRLRDRGLVRAGRVKEFYFELNMIVRRYIERRFGLRAPEMTTEEFMESLRESSRLGDGHQRALNPFMEACDLVKYARHEPTASEIEDVDRTAEAFVRQTAHASDGAHAPTDARERLEAALEEAVP